MRPRTPARSVFFFSLPLKSPQKLVGFENRRVCSSVRFESRPCVLLRFRVGAKTRLNSSLSKKNGSCTVLIDHRGVKSGHESRIRQLRQLPNRIDQKEYVGHKTSHPLMDTPFVPPHLSPPRTRSMASHSQVASCAVEMDGCPCANSGFLTCFFRANRRF